MIMVLGFCVGAVLGFLGAAAMTMETVSRDEVIRRLRDRSM